MISLEDSFNTYFKSSEFIEQKKSLDEYLTELDFSNLLGAIVLDSIFYCLHHYINIIISTESKENYSLDVPYDYFVKLNQFLNVDIPLNKPDHQKALGNPGRNKNDFAKILGKGNKETYRSQYESRILRNEGLHDYIYNIYAILKKIKQCIINKNESIIRILFLFFISNIAFNILKNHIFVKSFFSYYRLFTSIYEADIEDRFWESDNPIRFGLILQNKKRNETIANFKEVNSNIAQNIMADYLEKNWNISLSKEFWNDILKIPYIDNMADLSNNEIGKIIESIVKIYDEYYIICEEKKYTGNLNYINDIYEPLFQDLNDSEQILFSHDQPKCVFKKMRKEAIRGANAYNILRLVSNSGIDIIPNPFIGLNFDDACSKCPFKIYASSVTDLSIYIKSAVDDDKKYLDEIESHILGDLNDSCHLAWVDEMYSKLKSLRIIGYPKVIEKSHSNNKIIQLDNIQMTSDTEKMIQFGERFVNNTCEFFSPLSEILLNDGEDINIDDLLKSIDKKPITIFLPIHESDCKRVDVIDAKKPFPYLSRRTICEWKSFFRSFCSREESISAKFSHDIPNNIAIENCYKKFLNCLRKSFIMNVIVEIRELGYVTQI